MREHKILIVGGGPAGLYAATKLGNGCVLCERGELPHQKSCGGLMTPWVYQRLSAMGFPERSFCASYSKLDLYFSEGSATLRYGYPLVKATPRRILSEFLLEKARLAGAEIRTSVRITNIDPVHQLATCQDFSTIGYSNLIIADGAAGIVSHLTIPRRGKQLHTLQYELTTQFDQLATGWTKEFGPNYPWAMGMGPFGVHIGIVGPDAAELPAMLVEWASRVGIELPDRHPEKWTVPYSYRGMNPEQHVYMIGDAAGVPSPFTGEGLKHTFMSADWVVRKITAAKDGPEKSVILRQQRLHGLLWRRRCRSARFNDISNTAIEALARSRRGRAFLAWFYGMGPLDQKQIGEPG